VLAGNFSDTETERWHRTDETVTQKHPVYTPLVAVYITIS